VRARRPDRTFSKVVAEPDGQREPRWLLRGLRLFERAVIILLALMLVVVVGLAVLQFGLAMFRAIRSPPLLDLTVEELLDLFGLFLLLLIGIELLEMLTAYLRRNVVHAEIVLEVALIAVARKVVVLEASKYPPGTLFAMAALILALAIAFWLQRRRRPPKLPP
jgi:uncharacterized membrane protein (DUF373 family)